MLLEIAIADAYGAGFEYCNENLEFNNLTYIRHKQHDVGYGRYTDDTQMSIAISEHIINTKNTRELCDVEKIIDSFLKCYHRDPRKGYSFGFSSVLDSCKEVTHFIKVVHGNSDKSGAAMRACPIGTLDSLDEILEFSEIQAKITHNSYIGILTSKIVALSCFYFINKIDTKENLIKWISQYDLHFNKFITLNWKGKVKSKGNMAVSAALTAIVNNNSMSELLKHCISFGGDTDTTAAIALGIASCSESYQKDLPENLFWELENGTYGRNYLIELNNLLFKNNNETNSIR